MLTALIAYYLIASLALFLFAVCSNKNALHAFGYGIALNIFPLATVPAMSMDLARIAGMPLAYLPITCAGLALAVRNYGRLPRSYRLLLALSVIYCIYAFFTTVILGGATAPNLAYWFAWPLNFLIFFSAAAFFSRTDTASANKVIKSTVMILVFGCLVGLGRYALGISIDANFMPVVNRNGTVVFIVMIFPLLFYIYKEERKSAWWLLFCITCIGLTLSLTFSRSGLIGLLAGIFLYYMRFTLAGILKLAAAVLVITAITFSGVADQSMQRLASVSTTTKMLMHGEDMNNSMSDYNRVMLLKGAIATAKDNFWFGTGLGLDNYRKGFRKVSDYVRDSKAHNFYISYFAELGIIGFGLLLTILFLISRKLYPLSSPHKAFKVSFLVIAIMMTMNEYILLPEIWFFFGMLAGMSSITGRTAQAARPIRVQPIPGYWNDPRPQRFTSRSPHG
ncbi:O-antigen ligase family protein [Alcaligenaceae bacterium]|nr:O-antigen ligase family protein [Alcaligenaceae bacterium]